MSELLWVSDRPLECLWRFEKIIGKGAKINVAGFTAVHNGKNIASKLKEKRIFLMQNKCLTVQKQTKKEKYTTEFWFKNTELFILRVFQNNKKVLW